MPGESYLPFVLVAFFTLSEYHGTKSPFTQAYGSVYCTESLFFRMSDHERPNINHRRTQSCQNLMNTSTCSESSENLHLTSSGDVLGKNKNPSRRPFRNGIRKKPQRRRLSGILSNGILESARASRSVSENDNVNTDTLSRSHSTFSTAQSPRKRKENTLPPHPAPRLVRWLVSQQSPNRTSRKPHTPNSLYERSEVGPCSENLGSNGSTSFHTIPLSSEMSSFRESKNTNLSDKSLGETVEKEMVQNAVLDDAESDTLGADFVRRHTPLFCCLGVLLIALIIDVLLFLYRSLLSMCS